MSFDHLESIYRNYDIRGSYPDEINELEVEKIGRALVEMYSAKKIVIGHDYRPSAKSLHQALITGITKAGADVIDVGMVTTPMLYHAAGTTETEVSVMLTGSHMPAGFNGMKICIEDALPLGLNSGLAELRDRVAAGSFTNAETAGKLESLNIQPIWHAHIRSIVSLSGEDKTKVIIDPANMVGILDLETAKSFPELEVASIFDTYDHTCPNHEANPIKLDTLSALGTEVVRHGAALGIGLDGDGDRIGVVDETGRPIPQDVIGILIGLELLKRNGGSGVITYDVRSSKRVAEVISAAGGTPVPWRIGHTYIRRKMRELDALYALELSGHHFFRETHFSEGGLLPALLLIDILRESGKPLSELAAEHQIYFHSTEINSEVERAPELIYNHLREVFSDAEFETIDGLTVRYKNWWCNVRPSANDPVMRLNLEADTEAVMQEKRDLVLSIITNNYSAQKIRMQ